MKTISAAMEGRLSREATTLCTCWEVIRLDEKVFTFTDLDRDFEFEGSVYKAETGFIRSAISNSATAQADELEVEGFLTSEEISADDFRAGLFDYAEVRIFMADYEAPEAGRVPLRYGRFGEATITSSGKFTIELRGLMQLLQQTVGRVYTPQCSVDLFSKECGVVGIPKPRKASAHYEAGDRVVHAGSSGIRPSVTLPVPNPNFTNQVVDLEALTAWDLVSAEAYTGDDVYTGGAAFRSTEITGSVGQTVDFEAIFGAGGLSDGSVRFSYHRRSHTEFMRSRISIIFDRMENGTALPQVRHDEAYTNIPLDWEKQELEVTVPDHTVGVTGKVTFRERNVADMPASIRDDHTAAVASQFDGFGLEVAPLGTSTYTQVISNPDVAAVGNEPSADGWSNRLRVQKSLYGFFGRNGAPIARLGYAFSAFSDSFSLSPAPVTSTDVDNGYYEVSLAWWQAAVNTNGGIDLGMRFYDASGDIIQDEDPTPVRIRPIREWQRRTKTIPIPSGARKARIIIEAFNTDPNLEVQTGIVSEIEASLELVEGASVNLNEYGGIEYEVVEAGDTANDDGGVWSGTVGDTITDGTTVLKAIEPKFNHVVQITEVFSRGRFRVSGVNKEDNWFQWGLVRFLDGPAKDFSQECIKWTQDTQIVELALPVPYLPEVGDFVLLNVGCDKKITTCAEKFNNALNHRGFPDIPGTDFYFKVGNPR